MPQVWFSMQPSCRPARVLRGAACNEGFAQELETEGVVVPGLVVVGCGGPAVGPESRGTGVCCTGPAGTGESRPLGPPLWAKFGKSHFFRPLCFFFFSFFPTDLLLHVVGLELRWADVVESNRGKDCQARGR